VNPIARQLVSRALGAFTSAPLRDARRWVAERRRRARGEPHRVLYFHQVDDPYSHLAAQLLDPLVARYDVAVEPQLVGPPPDAAAPERERLQAFARKDAADVAPGYGLAFPRCGPPAPERVEYAQRLLAGVGPGDFAACSVRVGSALWSGDAAALEALAREIPPLEADATRSLLAAGSQRRARLGHYLGAMFHYGGEWYWSVDRLHHLERRLASLGARRPGSDPTPIAPRPDFREQPPPETSERLTLEFYPSLRSPYSYIALERVFALPQRYPLELRLRPVLPMVMRGLPVPRQKQLYIVLDTRREAEDAGVPFGRICDPVGRPVERGLALFPWARERGRAAELLLSFARGAFAEGIDAGTDAGLRRVVERAGLEWEPARQQLEASAWREELEANRKELLAMGLWGVPSFRLIGAAGAPDFCTWGQDRIWRVEEEIRRRLG